MRIAADVRIFQDIVPQRIAVLLAEPIAPGISIATKLRRTALRIDQTFIWSKTKVATSDGSLLLRGMRQNLTVRAVTP